MPVNGIDHVNILADDVEASAAFYAEVLGLVATRPPGPPGDGRWLRDSAGQAIIHLGAATAGYAAGRRVGEQTGALHHVALACTGFDETAARLAALGIAHRAGGATGRGFRQIFLTDPSNVALELNFPD
ncbi:MAG: VOC family protein [Novosphingobium sp.]